VTGSIQPERHPVPRGGFAMQCFIVAALVVTATSLCQGFENPYYRLNRSPFGASVHLWTTRGPGNYPGTVDATWIPYDDGVDDGMTNVGLLKLLRGMGALWVRDYGYSESGWFYWPEKRGWDYVDSYIKTVRHVDLFPFHTSIGYGAFDNPEHNCKYGVPWDWEKLFKLQQQAAKRYKDSIRFYKIGHEVDNIDDRRWHGTVKEYVRYLKVSRDAIKSVDPTITVGMGDLAYPDGSNDDLNNFEMLHKGGKLDNVDERMFEKILHEITVNGKNPEYDTTKWGGFPASTNPLDYFEVVGFNCYPQREEAFSMYDDCIRYLTGQLAKHGLEGKVPLEINETGYLMNIKAIREGKGDPDPEDGSYTTRQKELEKQATFCRDCYRYVFNTGKVDRIYYFHFDPMNYFYEALFASMVTFDNDLDGKPDPEITRFPVWFAFAKAARADETFDDIGLEHNNPKAPWFRQGWQFRNWESCAVSAGALAGVTKKEAHAFFTDMALPARFYPSVTIRMKSSAGGTGALWWDNTSTGSRYKWDRKKCVTFPVPATEEYADVVVKLSDHTGWTGVIGAVRLDPVDAVKARVSVDRVQFNLIEGR
jgi:hypothetical protein